MCLLIVFVLEISILGPFLLFPRLLLLPPVFNPVKLGHLLLSIDDTSTVVRKHPIYGYRVAEAHLAV